MSEKIVARVVMRASTPHPKTGEEKKEVAFMIRPWWSNVGAYEKSLPGGKLEASDFVRVELDEQQMSDEDLLLAAGLQAVLREILEEFNFFLEKDKVTFVASDTNESGWTTLTYASDVSQKPELSAKPETAGTVWIGEESIKNGEVELFADHLFFTVLALEFLDASNEKHV